MSVQTHQKSHRVSRTRAVALYVIVSMFLFFEMLVQVSPSVIALDLMHDLNLGAFALGTMSGIYFYSYTLMQIPSGLLFDKYNPRKIITASILLCTLGTLLFALTTNLVMGCMARLLMGTGSAFAFVAVLIVTADLFDARYFATMTGITQMLAAFGAMSGQLPVSLMSGVLGWRGSFYLLSALGAVLALAVWRLLNYPKGQKHDHAKMQAESSIQHNLKKILLRKQTWIIAIYACLLWAPMSGFTSLWGVTYLEKAYALNQEHAAFICSLMWLGLAVASPLLGAVSTRYKSRIYPLAFSALIGAAAFFWVFFFHLSTFWLMFCMIMAGAACSGQALSFAVIKEINPEHARATAIAVNNMAVVVSGAIFQPLIGLFIQSGQQHHFDGYFYGALIFFTCCLVGSLLALFAIKESFGRDGEFAEQSKYDGLISKA